MALENNLVVDSDAELKAFLSSILSSEGIVVNINRTFIAYNNGTNRNRVFARCANRMAQKGTDEKFVVIALMCYPALNWILKARDIDAMIEQLHDMDTDGSVRNISEIQSLLENSTGYVKPRLHLEMRKLFFARCQQLVDAVDDAMNRAVFRSAQPCKPARISLAMAMLRGSILDSDPVSAVMIRNNFDGIIEGIGNGKVLVVIATYGATGDESINDAANEEVTALLSSAAPANDGASLLLDNVPADFDGRTLSLTNERVLVKDGDSEVVFAPASYNADDIQFTDTKQTLSGFTVARSDYADSDSSKTYLVEGTDHNFLAVTNNEDLLNSILQVQ